MGDRYFLTVLCTNCGHTEYNVYYAPTCGFVDWKCPKCGDVVDLEKYSGISYEDASNRGMLEQLVTVIG
jgi:transposase-like protein